MALPTTTICFKPYFKASLSQKHSINSMISMLENDDIANKWEMFETLSYSLGKDIFLEAYWLKDNVLNTKVLNEGINEFNKGTVEIIPVATLRHGQCYLIKKDYNVSVTKVTYFALKVTANPT